MIRTTLRVAAGLALVAAPAAAQSWQTIGTPSNANTGAYWNNTSDDNNGNITPTPVCNVGAILTNTPALSAAACNNQGPVYLPLNPAPLTTQDVFLGGVSGSNPGGFRFAGGGYNFGLLGRVAGDQGTAWGIITDGGAVFTAAQLTAGPVWVSDNFAIWISAALPASANGTVFHSTQQTGLGAIGARASTTNQQFAVFTRNVGVRGPATDAFGAILAGQLNQTFYVGMEDNVNGGRGFDNGSRTSISDRDYNDILISVQAVPEPSTYALMATGLAGLAAMARRRRKA